MLILKQYSVIIICVQGATTNQTINITLTNKVKDYYNRNNCNGFYTKLSTRD